MKELVVEALTENLDEVLEFVEGELEENDCPMKIIMQMNIAVEEIFVNIAHYAYKPEVGSAVIRISVGDEVAVEFEDQGRPYNPLEKDDPDVTLSAEEREIGGLGIFMVKKSMDDIAYRHENGKNILVIKKLVER